MKYDLIIIYAGTGIPDGDLSPRVTGMGKKCPPQTFVGIPAGKFFHRGDGDGKPKSDGEFPVAISIRNEADSKDKIALLLQGPRTTTTLASGTGRPAGYCGQGTEGGSISGRAGFEGPQKGPKFACLLGKGARSKQTVEHCLPGPGVLEQEQKGTTPKHGAWAQVASCSLQQAASIGPLWRSSAGTAWVASFEVLKKLAGDVNGGPSPSCACPCMYVVVYCCTPGIRATKHTLSERLSMDLN
jgi:hypothetical protein